MKVVANKENPNGIEMENTAEELAQQEIDKTKHAEIKEANRIAKENNENLKASAKAKLIAGEPLTEEEANLMLGG
jgi:hypothetical protein